MAESKSSLEFMPHQCGALILLKGGHMSDSSPWQKVEQLNVECETGGRTDTYGNCETPGNFANMGTCEISNKVLQEFNQPLTLNLVVGSTGKTVGWWLGAGRGVIDGKSINQVIAMYNQNPEKRKQWWNACHQVKRAIEAAGYPFSGVKVNRSTIPGSSGNSRSSHIFANSGLAFDIQLDKRGDTLALAKKLYTMQRQGKLCANQIIWEARAWDTPGATVPRNLLTTEDNLNTPNAPGSQPVPTSCSA